MQSIEYRKYQLVQLIYLIKDNIEAIENAVISDLGRPTLETRMSVTEPRSALFTDSNYFQAGDLLKHWRSNRVLQERRQMGEA